MRNVFIILIFLFLALTIKGQQKRDIYFLLKKGNYTKSALIKKTTIKTTRIDSIFSFTLPCECHSSGSIGFYRGINPEVGQVNLPVKTVGINELNRIDFLSFDELIRVMKDNDEDFNLKYNLFLVEPGKVNYVYHVFKMTLFANDANDRVGP